MPRAPHWCAVMRRHAAALRARHRSHRVCSILAFVSSNATHALELAAPVALLVAHEHAAGASFKRTDLSACNGRSAATVRVVTLTGLSGACVVASHESVGACRDGIRREYTA